MSAAICLRQKNPVFNAKLLSSKYCCLLVYLTKQRVCINWSRFTIIHRQR